MIFTYPLYIFVLIIYPTIAIIITETNATALLKPISFILRVSFSVDGVSVKRGTVLCRTVWAVVVEVRVWAAVVEGGAWTTVVEDRVSVAAVEDRGKAFVVDSDMSSVVQSKELVTIFVFF